VKQTLKSVEGPAQKTEPSNGSTTLLKSQFPGDAMDEALTDRSNCGISPFVRGLRHTQKRLLLRSSTRTLVEYTRSSS
jgi:hypothetical protein